MRRFPKSIFFYAILLMLTACGSTHQMMPPVKLHHKEYQANFTISYDLSGMARLPNLGFNFYWGAGKDYVIGTAYQLPFGFPHLTTIKYLKETPKSDRYMYASLNGLLSMSPMLILELGGGANRKDGESIHSFTAGLGAYLGRRPTSIYLNHSSDTEKTRWHFPMIRPLIKYEYSHLDFRFSLQNYMGYSEHCLTGLRNDYARQKPLIIPAGDIDSLYFGNIILSEGYVIKLKNGEQYIISGRDTYPDAWWPNSLYSENRFKVDSETAYYFINLDDRSNFKVYGIYEINIAALMDDYSQGKDLVFRNKIENTELIKKKIKWYLHDWSVAVGIRTNR